MFEHTEGLPKGQGKIKTVVQSMDGYLWVSVLNYGLVRYDGYQFRSFIYDKDDSISMPTRNITDIIPSSNKGLWLVTDKGLIWFDLRTYQSKVIKKIPQQVFETIHGWSCVEDKLGKLWVFGHGLYFYDPSSDLVERISDMAFNDFSDHTYVIQNYFFQNDYCRPRLSTGGSIWLATATAPLSLIRIDPLSKAITSYRIPTNYSYTAIGVLPDPDSSHVWLSFSGRIARFNLKEHSWLFIDFKENNLIQYPEPYLMSHIEDDKLWLVRRDLNGNSITILDTKSFNAQLFKNDQKLAGRVNMTIGLYGARWIWDDRDRLFSNITESKRFTYFKILPQDEIALCYWKDKKNNIEWFGTVSSDGTPSLYKYDLWNRSASRFKIPVKKSFALTRVNQLNANELLLLLTSTEPIENDLATPTLFKFNTASGFFKPISSTSLTGNFSQVIDIVRDKQNTLWLTTFSGNLLKYDSSKDSFYLWNNQANDPPLHGIAPGSDRTFVWAGGNHLYKVYVNEHKIEKFQTFQLEKLQSFRESGGVIPLIEDQKGNVLLNLSKSRKVVFYNPSTKEVSTLPLVSRLFSPTIDSNNNVIAIIKNGLLFYNTETRETKFYNEKDGLLNVHMLNRAEDNELLIDDSYRVPLSFFSAKNRKPPIQFLSIKASDKELSPEEYADSSASVVLNHHENNISIEFAYLNFLPNRYNKYTCSLEGLDTTWLQLGTKNFINYYNLAHGSYTFRVKAIDTDGVLTQERVLRIEIVPAFWQTLWFKVVLVVISLLFIASVSYWIYRNRLHKLRLKFELEQERIRQQQKELEFEKRLADLTLSALRSQINPHFIFNCLNSIKLYATENDIGAATDYLTKFSKLIRQVLDNSMNEQIALSSELEVLRLYIEMEAMRFKEKLRYSITIDKAVDADYIDIPPLLLQPYVENAIWHGLMPKEEGGNLEILVATKDEDTVSIQIKDDGVGREKSTELNSRINPQHRSFGMKATSERMNLINQKYKKPINVRIDDLKNENGEPSGTLVTIQIQSNEKNSYSHPG